MSAILISSRNELFHPASISGALQINDWFGDMPPTLMQGNAEMAGELFVLQVLTVSTDRSNSDRWTHGFLEQ